MPEQGVMVSPKILLADSQGELRHVEEILKMEDWDVTNVMIHLKMAEIKALQSIAMRISRM